MPAEMALLLLGGLVVSDMNERIVWEVEMAPFGKARPRVTRRGTFMPDRYVAARDQLRLLSPFQAVEELDGPLLLHVVAWRAMPRSWSKRRRQATAGTYCTTKPDADNILGAVMDALLADDAQVVDTRCVKRWGWGDKLEITAASLLTV